MPFLTTGARRMRQVAGRRSRPFDALGEDVIDTGEAVGAAPIGVTGGDSRDSLNWFGAEVRHDVYLSVSV
ncbi:hypothetical protein [Nocardia sp. NPDC049149]|uniref:hypothetical protein n=1 Tax=Nocardia sp. NPDC049149 TaxID=3364315 RepID=UPI003723F0A1